MEYRVTWSPEAVEDIESIAEYIKRNSSFYAQSIVSKIIEASRNIKEFPLTGRVVPEIGDKNIREIERPSTTFVLSCFNPRTRTGCDISIVK